MVVSNVSESPLDAEFSPMAPAASPQQAGTTSASSAIQDGKILPSHIAAPRAGFGKADLSSVIRISCHHSVI